MDGKLPVHVPNLGGSDNVAEYPFESMIQARVIHRRENTLGMSSSGVVSAASTVTTTPTTSSPNVTPFVQPAPPPPYPAAANSSNSVKGVLGSPPTSAGNNNGSNNIAISSPLLVNLLQNEGAGPSNGGSGMAKQQQSQDRVNSSSISSGNGQANSSSNKGLMSKSTLATSQQQQQQQMIQQQVAGTHDKQAIVINNNLLSNKSPNNGSNELSNSVVTATTSSTTPLMQTQAPLSSLGAQSSPVPLPTNANMNNAGQIRRQMSGNVSLPMQQQQQQQRAQHSIYFARTPQQQQNQQTQQFKYVVPNNALRQQLPPPQAAAIPNASSYPNASGGNVNVRWKQIEQQMDPGCQEFDRYQKQYNHSQQQQENTQVIGPGAGDLPPSYGQQQQQQPTTNRSSSQQHHSDPLGLGNLADLADLSKNDLDSLLPSLHPHDLDSALLAFDTKGTTLDSLLDIDLISSLDAANSNNNSHGTAGATASGNSSVVTVNHSQPQQQLTNGPIIESNHSTSSPQVQLKHTGNKVTTTSDVVPQRFLINPLTGDMEETQVEDTSEQDANNVALVGADFHETYKSDENDEDDDDESSRGTNFSAKFLTSDMSDTEKSNQSGEHMLLQMPPMKGNSGVTKKGGRTKKEKILNADGTLVKVVKEKAQKTRVSKVKKAVITPVPSPTGTGVNAELKLRLKLDTGSQSSSASLKKPIASKPTAMVAQQYNFNASIAQQFMQQSQISSGNVSSLSGGSTNVMNSVGGEQQSLSTTEEPPRVPPLHISIKNKSVVIKTSAGSAHKKEKKRFLSVSILKSKMSLKTLILALAVSHLTVKGMLMRG